MQFVFVRFYEEIFVGALFMVNVRRPYDHIIGEVALLTWQRQHRRPYKSSMKIIRFKYITFTTTNYLP